MCETFDILIYYPNNEIPSLSPSLAYFPLKQATVCVMFFPNTFKDTSLTFLTWFSLFPSSFFI